MHVNRFVDALNRTVIIHCCNGLVRSGWWPGCTGSSSTPAQFHHLALFDAPAREFLLGTLAASRRNHVGTTAPALSPGRESLGASQTLIRQQAILPIVNRAERRWYLRGSQGILSNER